MTKIWNTIKPVLFYFSYQIGFSVLFIIIAAAISISNGSFSTETFTEIPTWALVATILCSTIAMGAHLIYFKNVNLREVLKPLPLVPLLLAIVWVIATSFFVSGVITLTGLPNNMEEMFAQMSRNPFGILDMAILAPILEELLFRGAMQGYMLRIGTKPWIAIITSALVFGVVHGNPIQIPFAFVLGLLLGWLYWRTGSLLPAILGHIINNSIATLEMVLAPEATAEAAEAFHTDDLIWLAITLVLSVALFILINKKLPQANNWRTNTFEEKQVIEKE